MRAGSSREIALLYSDGCCFMLNSPWGIMGSAMDIRAGEIYGKRTGARMVMYSVLKVTRKTVTLQNVDNPLSLFETTAEKLERSGYECVSQTPYISVGHASEKPSKRRQARSRPKRCPHTIDFFEGRADCEKPKFA